MAAILTAHSNGIDATDPEEKAAMDAERELNAVLVQYASPLAIGKLCGMKHQH